jgi:hypothetical protein
LSNTAKISRQENDIATNSQLTAYPTVFTILEQDYFLIMLEQY